jgi:hypothetical protein
MDFRTSAQSTTDDAITGVEEVLSESIVSLVLHLNEDELRPLFLKMAHWKASSPTPQRRLVFFRVVNHLAEKLRVRFLKVLLKSLFNRHVFFKSGHGRTSKDKHVIHASLRVCFSWSVWYVPCDALSCPSDADPLALYGPVSSWICLRCH